MDKFHIYEEIGKGPKSQVYKGREKSTITYVAIKRIDKSEMSSVSSQVALMHRFDSPYVLKFHDWYETRNNLWLILEYAPGGDLKTLLANDCRMPEESIRMFGIDIMEGLLYMHGQGVLYGDLKPGNVMVDEFGVMKLSDFGHACRIPTLASAARKHDSGGGAGDNDKDESSLLFAAAHDDAGTEDRKGTPHYMAPELFSRNGVRSYASDLWSFGVVLYEMFYGVVPFTSSPPLLSSLIKAITDEEPTFVIGGRPSDGDALNDTLTTRPSSHTFRDLLERLLDKEPRRRPTWKELRRHPFWDDDWTSATSATATTSTAATSSGANPFPTLPLQPLYELRLVSSLVENGTCDSRTEAERKVKETRPDNVREKYEREAERAKRRDEEERYDDKKKNHKKEYARNTRDEEDKNSNNGTNKTTTTPTRTTANPTGTKTAINRTTDGGHALGPILRDDDGDDDDDDGTDDGLTNGGRRRRHNDNGSSGTGAAGKGKVAGRKDVGSSSSSSVGDSSDESSRRRVLRLSSVAASNLRKSKEEDKDNGKDGGNDGNDIDAKTRRRSRTSEDRSGGGDGSRWDIGERRGAENNQDDEDGDANDDVKLVGTDTVLDFTDHDKKKNRSAARSTNDEDDENDDDDDGHGQTKRRSGGRKVSADADAAVPREDYDDEYDDDEESYSYGDEDLNGGAGTGGRASLPSPPRRQGSPGGKMRPPTPPERKQQQQRRRRQTPLSSSSDVVDQKNSSSSSLEIDSPFRVSELNITTTNGDDTADRDRDRENEDGPATEIDNLSACSLVDDAERAMLLDDDDDDAAAEIRDVGRGPSNSAPAPLPASSEKLRCAAYPFRAPSRGSSPSSSALSLIMHPSDATVKPIVGNKSIEGNVKVPVFRVSAITSITVKTRAEIKALGEGPALEAYFGTVYKCLASSSTTPNEKSHIFGYLYSVSDLQSVANLIANSSFVTLLLRMLRKKTGGDVGRASLAFVLGLVVRHASFIAPDASEKEEGLLHVLTGLVREGTGKDKSGSSSNSAPMRRRGIAALGELIFYIATGADGEGWLLPADTINTLSKCLIEDEDPVVTLYAAKVVENVLAQAPLGDSVSKRMCTQEIAQKLVEMSQLPHNASLRTTNRQSLASSTSDSTMTIASAALSQLLSHLILGCGAGGLCSSGSLDLNSSKISYADWYRGVKLVARVLVGGGNQESIDAFKLRIIFGVNDANDPKMQQAWLNIINLLLWDGPANNNTATSGAAASKGKSSGSGDNNVDLSSPTPRDNATGIPTALKLLRSAMTMDGSLVDQEMSGHGHGGHRQQMNVATHTVGSSTLTSPILGSNHHHQQQQQSSVVAHLTRLAERGENPVVRGKALIAIMGLCKISASTLSYSCEKRLLQVIERIGAKGEDLKSNEYFWSCASSLVAYLTSVSGSVLRDLASESERYVGVGATADMLQQQRREMRVITDKAIKFLPCVAQFVGCGLLREQGCVTSALVQDLGWALHTFGIQQDQQLSLFTTETQGELTRLLMLVLEKFVQHSEECVYRHCGDFIESALPILFRFLSSTNDDLSLSSLSLLRIVLPGIFVHVRVALNVDAAQSSSIKGLLLNLCERHLLPAVAPLLKKEGTISQYSLLLLHELAGAAGELYGTSAKAVWSGLSSAVMRSTSSNAIVKVLMDKVKVVASGGGEGGSSVLPNCICALIENGFKETSVQRTTRQLPDIVVGFLGHSFVTRCCKCLYEAISRDDSAATVAWLNVCKSLLVCVTSVLPADSKSAARSPVKGGKAAGGVHTPLESPPPVARGSDADAWGSSILSPGDLERMNLRGGGSGKKNGGKQAVQQPDQVAMINTCGQVVDEFAAASVLLAQALSHFEANVSHREAIDDLSSWLLSAIATLSPDVCFEKWLDEKNESEALGCLTDTVRAYLNSSGDKSRVLVRSLRVLYIAAMRGGALLREIANNYILADYLRKLTGGGGGGGGGSSSSGKGNAKRNEPAIEVASNLLTLLNQFAASRKRGV